MSKGLYMPTQSSSAASGVASAGAEVVGGLLQDDDPTDKGSVGKAALSGAAKGAAAGMAFGPWGAAIGAAVGTGIGALKGVKAKKEGLAANEEMARQKEITDSIAANNASMQQANTGNDISAKASMNPAYGSPVFNPQQSNTIQSVFDPNQKTSVV
jgi:phage tail tape-measure protein